EPSKVITVKEDSDVVLPCSLSTKNITSELFDWRKVAQKNEVQKEVYMYDNGTHYNSGLDGQSEEFKGRVSHFQDELKHGNASIIIRNTKISDSGDYSCDFPKLQTPQTFYVKLVVGTKVIKVEEGSDVILPFYVQPKKDITSKVFIWRKRSEAGGKQKNVLLYDKDVLNKATAVKVRVSSSKVESLIFQMN
ncbi:hypothetical protein FQN60_000068, partial [Etheostoma spectabile]